MRPLDRKLLRDMRRLRAQLVAIVLVVACGVASYVTMMSVHASLQASRDSYFRRHRLPHVFAQSQRAPERVAERMREIPGVVTLETRVAEIVTLDVPGLSEPAVGRLVGTSDDGHTALSRLHLQAGRWLQPEQDDEALVGSAFAKANELEPGDALTAIVAGRRRTLRVAGIVLSPEHVFQIGPGGMFPDDRRFGVLWMNRTALAAGFDMEGAFNEVVVTVADPADVPKVLAAVDRLLEPYGGVGAHGRDKQMSYRFVRDELAQLESIGTVMPTIFLGVAAFLLNVVISRLVGGQREQIAALKALGYGNTAIGIHYAKLVLLIALLGTALGSGLGAWMGQAMIGLYQQFFQFPVFLFRLDPSVVVSATALTVGAGLIGTVRPVRRAVSIPPAEAMRPAAPARYRRTLLERIGLGRLLAPPGRIVLRNLARSPWRLVSSVAGIALSIAILIAGNFSRDALELVMRVNFELAQRDDVTVTFAQALEMDAVRELARLPGVTYAEPTRDIPVRLRAGHLEYETAIQGLPADSQLRRILDAAARPFPVPPDGLLLTDELGHRLGVDVGDRVEVEVLEGERERKSVAVAGFVDEMVGLSAYMQMDALHRLLEEGPRATGARLLLDPNQRDAVYVQIKELPQVAGATLRKAAYSIFNETTAQMQFVTAGILVLFAGIVAVGVIYNGARVVLAERSRELASLRVLGFTRAEISVILLGELGVQIALAVPLGCLLGYVMAYGAISGIDTELYRFPLYISPRTYAFAVGVVVLIGVVTSLVVRRKLDHLDLVEVLKTRE